jgi:NADH dehydrogenase (ubiquinone) Fe-S protein 3
MFLIHHHYGLRKKYLSFLFNILKKFIKSGKIKNKMIELKINSKNIYSLSLFLKKHTKCLYKILTDIVVYDCPGKKFRFTVLYNLLSISYNSRIIISTKLLEKLPVLLTLVPLYSGAGWLEREA